MLIERWGFQVQKLKLKQGRCMNCGEAIEGMWE
jgi:hypothetical protein